MNLMEWGQLPWGMLQWSAEMIFLTGVHIDNEEHPLGRETGEEP